MYYYQIGFGLIAVSPIVALGARWFVRRFGSSRKLKLVWIVPAPVAGLGIAALFEEYLGDREAVQSIACAQNMKSASGALYMYSEDWDEQFPPADRWIDCIDGSKYLADSKLKRPFHCPTARGRYGYAMNSGVANLKDRPDITNLVLLFETDEETRNAHGGVNMLAKKRHFGLNCVYYDGRLAWVNQTTRSRWVW